MNWVKQVTVKATEQSLALRAIMAFLMSPGANPQFLIANQEGNRKEAGCDNIRIVGAKSVAQC